jgi:hypothetical protein
MPISGNRDQKMGKDDIGLLAFGSSGPWEVSIDETLSGPERHFAQIEGPLVYLYFEIPTVELVADALDFLAVQQDVRTKLLTKNGTLSIIKNADTQVLLVKDDEFNDRYFLVIESKSGPVVRFTITDADLSNITKALRHAKEDLEDDTE